MERVDEFQRWLDRMLVDAKGKLGIKDETIAYILLKEGIDYYLKGLARKEISKNGK